MNKILITILIFVTLIITSFFSYQYLNKEPVTNSEKKQPKTKEIKFNNQTLKEGDTFNFSPGDKCIADTEAKLIEITDESIVIQRIQEQSFDQKYYPSDDLEMVEIKNNTCILAYPLCTDVDYEYCFTTNKKDGTTQYTYTTPSKSLFDLIE